MADLMQMMDELAAEDNRVTADILDQIRMKVGKDSTDEWNALISAASHLRIEAMRRDPKGKLYGQKEELDKLANITEDDVTNGLREQALKGKWSNGGRGGLDLVLAEDSQPVSLQLIFRRPLASEGKKSVLGIKTVRQDLATVALALRGLNAIFNPPQTKE